MLRVLIVDDSPVARDLLRGILEHEADISVVGEARDGAEAVELVSRLKPDVITMDVQMPRMDGYAATRAIMIARPTPIVIVSGSMESPNIDKTMESLRAGALTVIGKPGAPSSQTFDKAAKTLVDTVRTMSEVKVVRQRGASGKPVLSEAVTHGPTETRTDRERAPRIVAIAASTGGPQAVHQILSLLPNDFSVPILLVQHISRGFLDGFASWLNDSVALNVVVAAQHQKLLPATVYVAPDDLHLGVGSNHQIALSDGPPIEGFRPAATAMFESVAARFGPDAAAVILTGMGEDGVHGLRAIRRQGGVVYAQEESSCVVYGMPAAAAGAGLVDFVDTLDGIAASLIKMVSRRKE